MYKQAGFKDKMRRIRWDKPAPTIVAHLAKDGYMLIHPWHNRTISVREAARFQSFPDAFEFVGSMSEQYKQVGNAVPPLLAKALGEVIIKALRAN
jgi:DNA (cytosine-5)-methyltransferase 1